MPKEINVRALSSRKSRAHSPYQLNPHHYDRGLSHVNHSDAGKSSSKKDWEDVVCPVCMYPPHNAVLLLCSSHNKGCRAYMCDTSYRHSNCLDQFKKLQNKSGLIHLEHSSDVSNERSYFHADSQNDAGVEVTMSDAISANEEFESLEPNGESDLNDHEIMQLTCPLCRGPVKGWTVVQEARNYLNAKSRICAEESCSFVGNYAQLRKHARLDHPCARPTRVDPTRQRDWNRLEQETNLLDVMSSVRSAIPGSMVVGDYVIEDNNVSNEGIGRFFLGNWLNFLFMIHRMDPNAQITISRTLPARVSTRRSGRSRRNSALRAENVEADNSIQRNVSQSAARNNDMFGRAGASAQGEAFGSNATDFASETSRRSSSRRHSGGHGSQ
uniref:Uncharacterized protein n=1 Tax=Araucaria cunninghamii TaxID=56994 RepID=A0A0D6RAZ2_ARACU